METFRLGNVFTPSRKFGQMMLGALSGYNNNSIAEGMVFRRTGIGAFVETAQVVEVIEDRMGIPHVRFNLQVSRGAVKPTVECRTLALETFSARYKKSIQTV